MEPRLRRALGWAIVAGLCIAALVAIVALLDGDFDETDGRIAGTSLGFSVYTAVGAPGSALLRLAGRRRPLGVLAVVLAGAAYLALVLAIWVDDVDEGEAWEWWQIWGVASVLALGASHSSLVIAGRGGGDSQLITILVLCSIALGVFDATIAALFIAEVLEDPSEAAERLMGVALVLLVLTTALPPILRRLGPAAARASPLAAELVDIADRLDAIGGAEVRREAERLRAAARRAG